MLSNFEVIQFHERESNKRQKNKYEYLLKTYKNKISELRNRLKQSDISKFRKQEAESLISSYQLEVERISHILKSLDNKKI